MGSEQSTSCCLAAAAAAAAACLLLLLPGAAVLWVHGYATPLQSTIAAGGGSCTGRVCRWVRCAAAGWCLGTLAMIGQPKMVPNESQCETCAAKPSSCWCPSWCSAAEVKCSDDGIAACHLRYHQLPDQATQPQEI